MCAGRNAAASPPFKWFRISSQSAPERENGNPVSPEWQDPSEGGLWSLNGVFISFQSKMVGDHHHINVPLFRFRTVACPLADRPRLSCQGRLCVPHGGGGGGVCVVGCVISLIQDQDSMPPPLKPPPFPAITAQILNVGSLGLIV